MYDPTIFDNLKVALENQLYDLDTLEEQIEIRNRRDVMDFAVLSREFALRFVLRKHPEIEVEVMLRASVHDLAGEIMEEPNANPACSLSLCFQKNVVDPKVECTGIEKVMASIWEQDIELKQTIRYVYGEENPELLNDIEAKFKPRLTEDNMTELSLFLEHVLDTLHVLSRMQL
ncbi:hypothetical protein [Sporosarcina gallistercoris]|uniref:Uncharacterized protein n=1 Tax=Sporosarcina gallistercoris TaxID=2762245 RepID=A0ABR8PKB3_9BACL|nr:hypothetical protein [Sporosarcina gallistercoris]MBD7908575.1 hypothetical protein [Sporosarcina gallistercoris]